MTPASKSKVLLPLYIYPNAGAWDPLFQAAEAHPTLEFIVIVNPNNGPGCDPWWPNADYVREIKSLKSLPNVSIVGYVFTSYCKRPIEELYADIEKYATWSEDGLGVQGIFFDETPNVYSDATGMYLRNVTATVKSAKGLLEPRLVIHNPGTSVDRRFADAGPDITTVAEVPHSQFRTVDYQDWLATSPYEREKTSYMIHSTPEEHVENLVQAMGLRAEYVFLTDNNRDYYHSFGRSWERFVETMANNDVEVDVNVK